LSNFAVGDIVRPKKGHEDFVAGCISGSANDLYEIIGVDRTGNYVAVKAKGAASHWSTSPNLWANRFEKVVPVREEGKEIKPAHIKTGDEILVTRTTMGLSHMRQGVVKDIKEHNDRYGKTLSFQTEHRQKINWGQMHVGSEVFTLVKAAPERDELLDRLVGSKGGQVITFREALARKLNDERWIVVDAVAVEYSTEHLRISIGKSEVTWLKAEA
jgi:hypothetical protein